MSKNIVGIENVYEAKYVKSNKTMNSTEQKNVNIFLKIHQIRL